MSLFFVAHATGDQTLSYKMSSPDTTIKSWHCSFLQTMDVGHKTHQTAFRLCVYKLIFFFFFDRFYHGQSVACQLGPLSAKYEIAFKTTSTNQQTRTF